MVTAKEAEERRSREKALFKATLKKQPTEVGANSEDADEWEDVEEDFPHVKLEELLDNLKIDDGTHTDEEDL